MLFTFFDKLKIGAIMLAAFGVMWVFMINPHSGDWQVEGETEAVVKTLMSNSKVLGQPKINAIVTLENGRETVVAVPMKSNVRAGDAIIVSINVDAEKPSRKRYVFKSEKF